MLLAEEIKRMSKASMSNDCVDIGKPFPCRIYWTNRQQKLGAISRISSNSQMSITPLSWLPIKYIPSLIQYGRSIKPIGGHVLAHASTFRLYLRKAKVGGVLHDLMTHQTYLMASAFTKSRKKASVIDSSPEKPLSGSMIVTIHSS